MLNQVSLVGRLAKEPELISFENSEKVNLLVAVERNYRNRNGETDTDFIYVSTWGRLAKQCNRYLTKGRLIALRGRIEVNSWEDKESGEMNYRTSVTAEEVRFLDSRQNSSSEVETA